MKKEILVKFGNKIRSERLKKNLSQEAFADVVGVHRTYIGMIERAEKNITLLNIKKLADGLGISVSELMKLE